MSVLNNGVIWISGTEGKVGRSTDYGGHWDWITVPGYDSCDWRSLVAFSDKRALLLNAGEPAHLLQTTDGGATWKEVYTNRTKGIFFDGMAFRNAKEGIAIGDPIDGRFMVIRTKDGGSTWQEDPVDARPIAKEGEAIFAASGTSVRTRPDGEVCFVTGGNISRFISGWEKWTPVEWNFTHGSAGTGAFSVAFADKQHGVAVGGDYTKDTVTANNCLITKDGGRSWQPVITPPGGYRSCVQYVGYNTFVATGTSGTDISEDGGLNWYKISKEGYHVAGFALKGRYVWLAGSKKLASFNTYKL
ncbi:WD40/YVTN/BNR-like repeat-containing protein [Chitinophaga filiformis]|nr:oxidoreductase [Chitinophaga filiformis]